MAIERFLRSLITIERSVQGRRLSSGELPPPDTQIIASQPGRIVPRASAHRGLVDDAAGTSTFVAVFGAALPREIKLNDRLIDTSDGQPYAVVGKALFYGDLGTSMAHYEVPCELVGAGVAV